MRCAIRARWTKTMSSYDPKCLELANHVTEHPEGCVCLECEELAEAVQRAVDAAMESSQGSARKAGKRPRP